MCLGLLQKVQLSHIKPSKDEISVFGMITINVKHVLSQAKTLTRQNKTFAETFACKFYESQCKISTWRRQTSVQDTM